MEIIAAVVGLCFGTQDRTQIVSTVAGIDPAAKSPARGAITSQAVLGCP